MRQCDSFSMPLENTGSIEIGLKFDKLFLSPPLKTVDTLAICSLLGKMPDMNITLIIRSKVGATISITCFTGAICTSSTSVDLLFFRERNVLIISAVFTGYKYAVLSVPEGM